MEINRKKEEVKTGMQAKFLDTEAKQKNLQAAMASKAESTKAKMDAKAENIINNLQNKSKNE